MGISVLLVDRSFPWKTCIDWPQLEWISEDNDAYSTKGFRPVLLKLTENMKVKNILSITVIISPESKVELI